MAVAVKISHAHCTIAGRKSRTVPGTDANVVVEIPYRRLPRGGIVKQVIWMAVVVKVSWRSVWLESHSCNIASGGKDGAHSARGKLKNVAADPILGDKQIVRTVNSQTARNYWNLIVFRGDSASQP